MEIILNLRKIDVQIKKIEELNRLKQEYNSNFNHYLCCIE